jgi:hypothetical protein
MGISIPHVFTNGDMIPNADDMNENFAVIAAKLNGQIGDDEIADAGISEDNVIFSPTTGHDHSGGSKGKPLSLAEAQITFDPVEGHTHDGSAEGGRLAMLAIENSAQGQGVVKVRSGKTGSIGNATNDGDCTATITLTGIAVLLSLDVWWEGAGDEGALRNQYLGGGYDPAKLLTDPEALKAYYLTAVSNTGATITNKLWQPAVFYWRAIGI